MDAHHGARPWAAYSHKTELRLLDHLGRNGQLKGSGIKALADAVAKAARVADETKVEELLSFATSAIRDAANVDEVLAEVRRVSGVDLDVLQGSDEARLTFLAARRWCGWSAGRLLVFDIGGGSLEMAVGVDEEPEVAVSLPLGAARLTRAAMPADPPDATAVEAVRVMVAEVIAAAAPKLAAAGTPDRAVATSKTFKQLARIAGAAPSADGLYVRRVLTRVDLGYWTARLTRLSAAERAQLPGVSVGRARQLLAGAVVAEVALEAFGLYEVEICPWALREGLILRRLDWIRDGQN